MVLKLSFLFGNTTAEDLHENKTVLSVHQEIQSEGSTQCSHLQALFCNQKELITSGPDFSHGL
jgi:hypothetical protein